ncbi:tetratricopeptide repeat protein 19, mitochondrial isoform X2 [Hyla sarda]|uniref:tetratricopeptide repeat protein 19, mitochondrial isoform X2 n=1 Tax=Hyla sarda TaxID=327740 RepID=UPI0024C2C825|nr:tetratricopeptide repeat protein 19, mitochondrial isoform X2 [Hyla sarda]
MFLGRLVRVCASAVYRSGVPAGCQGVCRGSSVRPRLGAPSMSRGCVLSSGRQEGTHKSSARPPIILLSAAAFSFFSKLVEDKDEGLTPAEENIVYNLKRAKLSIMKGEMEEAEEILHRTLRLAHECKSKRAITYTYDLMANLAFLKGEYENAEKLFKTTLVYMIDGGVKEDDNSFIEISLKLASICAALKQEDLAVAGFQFCIITLNEKIEKEKDLSEEIKTEERTNTRLLLGLCLDSYARYLVANSQLFHAQTMYERALQICREEQGELHPQTVTLLSDLATVLEAQGRFDEALTYIKQALDSAQKTEHPNQHVILGNMAMILLHQEHLVDAERIFKEALTKAEEKKDSWSIYYIQEGLSELARRKKKQEQNL